MRPESVKKIIYGYVNPLTEMIFKQYCGYKKSGIIWLSQEAFKKQVQCKKDYEAKRRLNPQFIEIERAKKRAQMKSRRMSQSYKDKEKQYKKTEKYKAWSSAYTKRVSKLEPNIEARRENERHRRKTDIIFRLRKNMRGRIYDACKRQSLSKLSSSGKMIQCGWQFLKAYIEARFLPGMSWENYGKWHIDHIIPLSSAKTPKELKALCKYNNLMPLWSLDNISKGDSMTTQGDLFDARA